MGVSARQDCRNALRTLIHAADGDGFGVAQNLLLRFALSHDGPERRAGAMNDLLADLAGGDQDGVSQEQRAFRAALVEMIERTKLTVGPNQSDLQG